MVSTNYDRDTSFWLVVSTPLKNMKVIWDDDIPHIWKVIKFHGSEPPTSHFAVNDGTKSHFYLYQLMFAPTGCIPVHHHFFSPVVGPFPTTMA